MRGSTGRRALLLLPLVLAACQASAPPAPPRASAAPARVATAGPAFSQRETPFARVLADAEGSGRPALLFFWTSW